MVDWGKIHIAVHPLMVFRIRPSPPGRGIHLRMAPDDLQAAAVLMVGVTCRKPDGLGPAGVRMRFDVSGHAAGLLFGWIP
jgi:hypothetical protein